MKRLLGKSVAVAMAAFVVTCFASCGGNPLEIKGKDGVIIPYDGENKLGDVSDNLVANPDDDEANFDFNLVGDGTNVSIDENTPGADGTGKSWKIESNAEDWGQAMVDITDLYAQGKSYYVSAKFRVTKEDFAACTNSAPNWHAQMAYTIYNGAQKAYGKAHGKEPYDFDDWPGIVSPWGGEFYTDGEEGCEFGDEYSSENIGVTEAVFTTVPSATQDSEWITLEGIIPSTAIEEKVDDTYLIQFTVSFFVGTDNELKGYTYHMDDVVIKDLNSEIEPMGMTWFDPDAPADDEGGEE